MDVQEQRLRTPELDLLARIQPRTIDCHVPLTENQLDHWHRTAKRGTQPTARLRVAAVRIRGPFDLGVLRASIEAVVQRHESLRTRIVARTGVPTGQYVLESPNYSLEVVDLSSAPAKQIEDDSRRLAQEFFWRKIELCIEPLFAGMLLNQSETEHVLLLALEHMVGDGVSCGILSREIWAAYNQITQRLTPSLPTLPVQFPDYAVWERQTHDARRRKDEAYWADRIARVSPVRIPRDSEATFSETPASAMLNLPFGKVLSNGLRAVAQRERTLLPIVVLTVHLIVMSQWCDQPDWSPLFVSHGRYRRPELQNMIGYLSKGFPLRMEISRTSSLSELLRRAHLEFIGAIEHQDYVPPLPDEIDTARVFNWGGLVTYNARWSVNQQQKAVAGIRIQPFPVDLRASHNFYPNYSDTPAGIVATVHYRSDVVAPTAIQRLGCNMRIVAEALVQRPAARVGSLSLAW
jgi:hypothetical protein